MSNESNSVVLATSGVGLEKDPDLASTLEALRERGVDAAAVRWDDPDQDWSAAGSVVIRSTWDYGHRLAEYLAWADRVGAVVPLHNPAPVVRWNSDKHYLRDLAAQGVPVVPTAFLEPGDEIVLPTDVQFVVKPTVSAGARDTARYTVDQAESAADHVRALHARGESAMVQPYLARIAEGERAVVLLDGEFSHAVRKGPVLTDIGVIDNARVPHPDLTEHQVSSTELELARAAVAAAARSVPGTGTLLVARVDLVLADDGAPVVMELELIEPHLFLGHSPGGYQRFAQAVQNRTGKG